MSSHNPTLAFGTNGSRANLPAYLISGDELQRKGAPAEACLVLRRARQAGNLRWLHLT